MGRGQPSQFFAIATKQALHDSAALVRLGGFGGQLLPLRFIPFGASAALASLPPNMLAMALPRR